MNKMISAKTLLALICFFYSLSSLAQLPDFSLQVTATNESCTGNGTLAFATSNTAPGAVIIYSVYLLPNTTTPIANTSLNIITGLSAGNYRVVATQTLGSDTNFKQQDVVITTTIENLDYQLSGSVLCNDGVITVNIISGNPFQYEIISGPVIRPLQSSNVFTLLPNGVYVVRVVDLCGDAVVQTYALQNPGFEFLLDTVVLANCQLIDCDTAEIELNISGSGSNITYPVQISYIVHAPDGSTQNFSQTIAAGSPSAQDIHMNLPYYSQGYSIDAIITDACGHQAVSNGNIITSPLTLQLSPISNCSQNIKIDVCNFIPPITVDFLSVPAGFNPLLANSGHPGPFSEFPVLYVSTQSFEIPLGFYTIQITDGCGRTAQSTIELGELEEPGFIMAPSGCGLGQVLMPGNPNGADVAVVIITAAPPAYNNPLPHNVSGHIVGGKFMIDDLPAGTYVFSVVTICGEAFEYTVIVPPVTQQPVQISYMRGCTEGMGSLRMAVQSTDLLIVRIDAAPAAFTQTLPFDISSNIFEGKLYMNGLPQGLYTLYLKDECIGERIITINIPGYHELTNAIAIDENCGSFNLALEYSSNESSMHLYWLQKRNPITGNWSHPITGLAYISGMPDFNNSLSLANHATTFSIASTGTFRVVKAHKVFGNGTDALSECIITLKEFIFNGVPRITAAFSLPCTSSPGQVVVIANGLEPLHYYITLKDGQPFYVDNNTSNTFAGLTPGLYNFQVRDVCQNIVNRIFDLGSIPAPNIQQGILCNGQNGQLSVQAFDFLSYQWWNGNNPTNILSTTNTLSFTPFSATANSGTYYVRIYSTQPNLCTDQIVSYTIPVSGSSPQAGEGMTTDICGNSATIDLFTLLTGNSAGGNWQEITNSGMQIGHSWVPVNIPYGTYQFKYTVNGLCGTSDEALVTIHFNPLPATPEASANSLICGSGSIELSASNISGATYSWAGPNGFVSTLQNPVLNNASELMAGTYSVKAKIGNCESPADTVVVNVTASPVFTIGAGCVGSDYSIGVIPTLNSFNPANVTYAWTGPGNFTASTNPIAITGGQKGTYSVTVTTPEGCSESKTIEVLSTLCAIPSGISPNNDGDNEVFDLTGFDVLQFKIFNRYGRIVFEQNDYTNQWHGQDYNGRELPDATYYYYIKMKTGQEKTGWVYVTK